jgi:hypothetical protein
MVPSDRVVVIAVTCPLTDELRNELDKLGVLLLERNDPLLLKLFLRSLRAALGLDGPLREGGKRPFRLKTPYVPTGRYRY